jgi:hypothetical protein
MGLPFALSLQAEKTFEKCNFRFLRQPFILSNLSAQGLADLLAARCLFTKRVTTAARDGKSLSSTSAVTPFPAAPLAPTDSARGGRVFTSIVAIFLGGWRRDRCV